ncbi:hypothetical protein FD51_GL000774 [Lacticaseibacillus zeae DSM 20178 = KCTC 3804]|uniref:ComC/BlpC family leader-containing pheromone/bacteriocin n=2 Tax=Lacticaseibacillus zeae TaxID=57037 RepID=A0A5R8LRR2_LACZE|nr:MULTISPECIES: ComC/BlpC family leader-containing pheromone/bacteriocin [Lacticaseibacillus]KRK11984.1 hypothetical protein FD51_GL000774 [Lacticaseibacillus zeae DSM 20178 = KCTC 3804]MDE3283351.1 ComC/BlpC family leader-containing pheromone/bacteriocin [Lacticaseibacillus casei]OLS11599.1 hypothetical protein AUQ39_00230 [Lacticaseibacillus casei]QVI31509.1 Blp family class II bacteriocin [Lacticaseibacillus zeae]TLF39932.1 ComC/BlpC family leader-containing pheromone/bacteriocin [Lacticas
MNQFVTLDDRHLEQISGGSTDNLWTYIGMGIGAIARSFAQGGFVSPAMSLSIDVLNEIKRKKNLP